MTPFGIFFFSCVLFGILLSLGALRRWKKNNPKKKMGCLSVYLTLILVSISTLTFPFIYSISDSFVPLFTGERMRVPIVDQTSYLSTSEDSEGRKTTTRMYTPLVDITLADGETIRRELDYSSGAEVKIGSSITIYYNHENDTLLSLQIISVITKVIIFMACLLMLGILWYAANYALGFSRKIPEQWTLNIGVYGIFPMMIISFTLGLLSYLYKTWILGDNPDNHPVGIALMVVFFAVCMLFVIYTYFRGIFGKNGKETLKGRIEKKAKALKARGQLISG